MQRDIVEGTTTMEEKTTSVFRIYIDQLEKVFVTGEEFEKILQDIMQKYQEKGLFIRYRDQL